MSGCTMKPTWVRRWLRPTLPRVVLFAVHLMHFLSSLYFFCVGYLMYNLTPFDAKSMQAYAPKPSAFLFLVLALVHASPLVPCLQLHRLVTIERLFRSRHAVTPMIPASSPAWSTFARRLATMPTNVSMALGHLLELISETWIAAQMARHLVQRDVAFFYAVVLASNATVTSWILLFRSSDFKKMLLSLFDSFLSFLLSAGIPLFQFMLPLVVYVLGGTGNESHDYAWLARSVTSIRTLIVWTPIQPCMVVIPSLFNYLTLRSVVRRVHKLTDQSSTTLASEATLVRMLKRVALADEVPSIARKPSKETESMGEGSRRFSSLVKIGKQAFNTHQEYGKWLQVVVGISTVWGLTILVVAVAAEFYRESCPVGCVYDSAPWLTTACNCIYFRWTCSLDDTDASVEARLNASQLGPSLLFLHIRKCAFPSGFHPTTLTQFQMLFGLQIELSEMLEWNIPSSALPNSLILMQIRYSQLKQVPQVLHNPGPNMVSIFLEGAPLGNIPSDILANWSHLSSLWLCETNMTEIPPEILAMKNLEILAVNSNNIETLPQGLQQMPQLYWLYAESNQISVFPTDLIVAKPRIILYLNHNPISTIPDSLVPKLGTIIDVASTPFCHDKSGVVCTPDCSDICSRPMRGNFLCDLPCNTSACNYDNGDCNF
ncbi:Aste57867_540 [Aphanomyces stellatus]|uniref:Aste57867_540 protein n=1 Tax=Aphanomyces stellatus TaxID=120398 RepID=A0A485K2V6_9STRA|nr:hypothetical protein As57867_000539 [Aphanomyces stellatus]VFT77765.1 Aste57867_540 [Aphanomyces stellatus]